jgi:PhoPQ-activated pathogenicity-related protein
MGTIALGFDLARRMKAPVAFLYGIPNQPLLGGKTEDALIAETFVRYLKTKDNSWPLLFPMVKSLVRAMDALQEFAMKEWKVRVRHFVVSGASKRGWTTWLTGASDARVKAIAPLVIDTLNFQLQIPHQVKSYGAYSEMIRDYTERGLVPVPDTPEAKRLWMMVDPWHQRGRLNKPVLMINGANDPYWTLDALNLYWDDLGRDKWVLYVPNAGHNLEQKHATGKKDHRRAVHTLAAFGRSQIHGQPLPKLHWSYAEADGHIRLTVESKPAPIKARLWTADAPTKDFRKAVWTPHDMTIGAVAAGEIAVPQSGYRAVFGELEFDLDGLEYYLSTQIRILKR